MSDNKNAADSTGNLRRKFMDKAREMRMVMLAESRRRKAENGKSNA